MESMVLSACAGELSTENNIVVEDERNNINASEVGSLSKAIVVDNNDKTRNSTSNSSQSSSCSSSSNFSNSQNKSEKSHVVENNETRNSTQSSNSQSSNSSSSANFKYEKSPKSRSGRPPSPSHETFNERGSKNEMEETIQVTNVDDCTKLGETEKFVIHELDSDEEEIKFRKKIRAISSDSEDEMEGRNKKERVESDKSEAKDSDNDHTEASTIFTTHEKPVKVTKRKAFLLDSDEELPSDVEAKSDEMEMGAPNGTTSFHQVFQNTDVYGADSSSDEGRPKQNDQVKISGSDSDGKNNSKMSLTSKQKRKRPKTKKQREKELLDITSRTQKMLRESYAPLPYHKPRQLTFDEFLKKRNASKAPLLTSLVSTGIKVVGTIVVPDIIHKDNGSQFNDQQKTDNEAHFCEPIANITEDFTDGSPAKPTEECLFSLDAEAEYPVKTWLENTISAEVEDMELELGMEKEVELGMEKEVELGMEKEVELGMEKEVELGMEKEAFTEGSPSEDKGNSDQMNVEIIEKGEQKILEVENDEKNSEKCRILDKFESAGQVLDISDGKFEIDRGGKAAEKVEAVVPCVQTPKVELDQNDLVIEAEDSKPVANLEDNFAAKEIELISFLEAQNPKPKKLTLAEKLKNMPGYANLFNFHPKVGKGAKTDSKGMIDLDTDCSKVKTRNEGVQTLMDRFLIHTKVVKPSKEQHYKINVSKKEEDSQGQEHVVVDEVDYVKVINSDEDESSSTATQSGSSIPGAKMFKLQQTLKQQIYAKKAKEFAEKLKLYEMYSEEKQLEDKNTDFDPLPDDEEIEDEMTESEVDEDEEEELEYLLSGTSKKKRRKGNAFVDDEAEDDDITNDDNSEESENDDHVDDDQSEYKDDVESLEDENSKTGVSIPDVFDEGFISDTLPSGQPQPEKKKALTDEAINSSVKINLERLDIPSNDQQKAGQTTSESWLRPASRCPPESDPVTDKDSVSVTLSDIGEPANSQTSSIQSQPFSCKSPIPAAVIDLVGGVAEFNSQNNDELLAVCSGTFPSQQPRTPEESQNDCFGFDDDDDVLFASLEETLANSASKTPQVILENPSKSVLENDTPKMNDKIAATTKRLNFEEDFVGNGSETPITLKTNTRTRLLSFNEKSDLDEHDSDDNESVVGYKIVKKRKRLEFSDEEDAGEDNGEQPDCVSEDGRVKNSENGFDDDEEMALELEARTKKVATKRGLFGKGGQLRKEFVDGEAELSGSEIGSEDEDERGLDRMEIEEGDEDVLDEEDVREKVGRAHLKALLDKDDEEIRHIQNELLHDGDLHMEGQGRERNFKWNYMKYDMDDDRAHMGDSGDEVVVDEDEMKRQMERAEKSKWIKENSQLFEESQEESNRSLFENSNSLRLSKRRMEKLTSFSSFNESASFQGCDIGDTSIAFTSFARLLTGKVKNIVTTNKGEKSVEEQALSKATSQPLFASPDDPISKMRKGSFLSRGAPTLSRLAEMTKISGESISNVKSNSKNFVFSVITPPNPAANADQDTNSKKPSLRRNQSLKANPKKMLKIDRSFNTLDSSSKDASIFKWI